MTSLVTEPIEIKPAPAPLTQSPEHPIANTNSPLTGTAFEPSADNTTDYRSSGVDTARPLDRDERRRKILIPIALLVALALLYGVFFVLPGMVPAVDGQQANTADSSATVEAAAESTSSVGQSTGEQPPTRAIQPFKDAQLARAKQQAEDELATFVELQIELEEKLQIATWGQSSYDEVKDTATRGDAQFVERDFEAALNSYRAATKALTALRDRGEADYASAIAGGNAALVDFNQLLAQREFTRALGYKANDPSALAGLDRASKLPQIQSLLRKARQLARRGDTQAATRTYREVLAIDPDTPTVKDALAELSVAATNADFQDALSRGFADLERGRYSAAKAAFNAALKIKPGDAVAKGGLQQIAQETEVRGLRALESRAAAAIAEEDWDTAVAAFDEALATDKNLEFAQAGRREALERQRLARGMAIIIRSADNLSDNNRMAQAKELLAKVDGMSSAGPRWDAARAEAASLIQAYSQPVAVTLTSDNATQVTVYKVGRLGTFRSHNLSLRPGAYTIVGTADRCQDVRREVIVRPKMAAIDIRCENRL